MRVFQKPCFGAAFNRIAGSVIATILLCAASSAFAQQGFPSRPLRLIVPFAAGGGTDLIARTIGEAISRDLGQPAIVENKPGGGTVIGSDAVAKSAPDGYTLLIATFAHAANPALVAKLPYVTEKAFAPVALIGRSPNVLVVRADKPWKSVSEVVAAARANPGKFSFGSQGNGTSAHLAGALFENLAKVQLIHVPYKGAGPAITDLLGGQIDMMFATASAVGQFIDSGKLRALAVTTTDRSPALAGVPTIAEGGVVGYAAESWYGIYVPTGTPRDVIARLNQAIRRAVQTEVFRKRVGEEGLVANVGTPEDLDRYVRGEETRWRRLIKEARISTD
jgi:tripartite-type tricarboxylate transporter receptor subunit TctC